MENFLPPFFPFLIKSITRQQKAMAPIDPSLCNCQCDPFTYVDEDGIKQGNCIRYYDTTNTFNNLISNFAYELKLVD